jgi:hypothetical protein
MRLTVGPLPATVYWRRRAVAAAAVALVVILVAVMCSGPDASTPNSHPSPSGGSRVIELPTSGAGVPTSSGPGDGSSAAPGSSGAGPGNSPGPGGTGDSGDDGADGGGGAGGGGDGGGPPVVATVACADAEIALTATVSPSPGLYGGVITLTLVVRNTADHPCLRDVGSAPQELQVRQGSTVVWSSDHCGTPQSSDVRAFGPNIESRFSLRWNTYRIAPHECDPPADAQPAAPGTYQVMARLGTKLSDPVTFEIQK